MSADTTFPPDSNYRKHGGKQWDIGGTLDILSGGTFKIGGTTVTPSATEFNTLTGQPSSIAIVTTTAGTGTLDASVTFKDAAGSTITHAVAGLLYLSSDTTGLTPVAATITDGGSGAVLQANNSTPALVTTTAAGALQIAATVSSGVRYLCFVGPDGRPIVTSALATVS